MERKRWGRWGGQGVQGEGRVRGCAEVESGCPSTYGWGKVTWCLKSSHRPYSTTKKNI